MRFRHLIFATCFSLAAAAAWAQSGTTESAVTADYVVALVNSEPITDSDLRMQTRIIEQQQRDLQHSEWYSFRLRFCDYA